MKPNYKALAEKYRNEAFSVETRLSYMYREQRRLSESLREKEREAEEWKRKYAEAMGRLIELQESILPIIKKEAPND